MYLSNGRAFFIWPFFCQSFISFLSQHSTHPHTSPRLSVFMYIDLDHCVLVFRAIPTPDTHLEWIFYSRRKFHRCFFLNIFLEKNMCTFYLLPTSFCLLFLRDAREWLSICETVSVSGHGFVCVCVHACVCVCDFVWDCVSLWLDAEWIANISRDNVL